MKRCPAIIRILLTGLFTAQIIATLHVHLSNAKLFRMLESLSEQGYLIVPNERVMSRLPGLDTAFFGALFYTLTVGAGITLFSLAALWVWDRVLFRRKSALAAGGLLWAALLTALNLKGFSPIVTSYFVFIPAVVFIAALRWMPSRRKDISAAWELIPGVPLVLLALLWSFFMTGTLFLDIRDSMLLSNPVGSGINDFYYRYTLYPAETFKSLHQKQLRSCNLDAVEDPLLRHRLENSLRRHDYLAIKSTDADLMIAGGETELTFVVGDRNILRADTDDFFSSPADILKQVSSKSDAYHLFRRITFFSLLIGFPVLLYIILYVLLLRGLALFMEQKKASVAALALCLVLGIVLFIPFRNVGKVQITKQTIAASLASPRWQERVAALKFIHDEKLEIGRFPSYRLIMTDPSVPGRYWLAYTLARSTRPETGADLLKLLDDSHPNVVCKAYEALGKRGNRKFIPLIVERIKDSDHWYCQWYAYKALRALGWIQPKST